MNRDYSDIVSFERANIKSGFAERNKVNTTANFTDCKIDESDLDRNQWSENSVEIKEVLNDVNAGLIGNMSFES